MPRPKGSKNKTKKTDQRDTVLAIRLRGPTRDAIEARATELGISMSEVARRALDGAFYPPR